MMVKKSACLILTICCLVIVFIGSSYAKEEEKKTKARKTSPEQALPACKSLKYTKIDGDTILITEGFSYQKDRELNVPHLMGIKGVTEGNIFVPDEGSVTIPGAESAVNVTWEFIKPDLVFTRDGCRYTSKSEGATIQFTKEGVLVKGFKISGKPKARVHRKKTR